MRLPDFEPVSGAPPQDAMRQKVRSFLTEHLPDNAPFERARSWSGWDSNFSKKLGEAGLVGTTWPSRYGGQDSSQFDRYTIVEELLAVGAPVAAHWFADRQSGAMLLRYASDSIRDAHLPRMAQGSLYYCIGMSEPGSGSDLASLKTRATRCEGGWRVRGSKIWTSHAQHAHFMIALVRTGLPSPAKHDGLSQIIIPMNTPGVTVRPIVDQSGDEHFSEVFLDDVFVPDEMLLGKEGDGWAQVNAELAFERSGPERFLSSHLLVEQVIQALCAEPCDGIADLVGSWVARLWGLRQMSLSVAAKLERRENPMIEASIVKDLGAEFEQSIPCDLLAHWDGASFEHADGELAKTMLFLLGASQSFTLRGGTREILRGIIARGVGLR